MQITVSLEVYKALTEALSYEGQTYDDVIRRIMGLDSPIEIEPQRDAIFESLEQASMSMQRAFGDPKSFYSRGLCLPNGTSLRAAYKGAPYSAHIEDGRWVGFDGSIHSSPSAAASAITGNNVNGLRFWEALLPGDTVWRRLETLVRT